MRRVTVDAPTKSRIDPKLGTDSAMKSRQRTENVLKAHRFQLKSKDIKNDRRNSGGTLRQKETKRRKERKGRKRE